MKMLIASALGGSGGLAWWWSVGCTDGGCAITGNPFLMVAWGAGMGLIIAAPAGRPRWLDGLFSRLRRD